MKPFMTFLGLLFTTVVLAQTTVSGKVTNTSGVPIVGANVYINGTYDGATTDAQGNFSFTTTATGQQTLMISFLAYETKSITNTVSAFVNLKITLREDVSALDAVVISAGTFQANDNSKVSVLKPLDVVTTASALGDFVGALQTLPGTTTVAEDGRLFVRGGDADETQIFIDGIRVFSPYSPTPNNIPTRGRYSPFLFDGITFSTGGYSAEYGHALSSVLLLNTIDEPDQNKTDIGLMTVGGGLGHTKKWNSSSLSVNVSYINLEPYITLFPDRNDWEKPYRGAQGETVFRQKFNSGLLKLYAAFDTSNLALIQEDINIVEGVDFKLKNNNFYTNMSYRGVLNHNWSIQAGLSYTLAKTEVGINDSDIDNKEHSAHLKLKLKKRFNNRFKLSLGAEQFLTNFDETYADGSLSASYGYKNNSTAVFAETDIVFSKKLALKAGLRADYYNTSKSFDVGPRASLAYKTSKNAQVALAYGNFFETVSGDYLKFNHTLKTQNAQHYIINYQFVGEGSLFRAETYRKVYSNLVLYDTDRASFESYFSNEGLGYAQGLDLFWRDNKRLKNTDYWISYSYLDTQRQYLNYPEKAEPSFANKHNFSAVVKYWVDDWKSQLGLSYTFASGRPYTNPNKEGFLNETTKNYNSLSFNWAYLLSQQKILYFSVNNVLGFKNINGYQYSHTPNAQGRFNRQALLPAADQFFFVGFFWTISVDGKDNQLNNL